MIAVALCLLAACSSGGGGSWGESQVTYSPRPSSSEETEYCTCIGLACIVYGCMPATRSSGTQYTAASPAPSFSSWNALPAYTSAQAPSLNVVTYYQADAAGVVGSTMLSSAPWESTFLVPQYDPKGVPDYSESFYWYRGNIKPTLASAGHAGIDLGYRDYWERREYPFANFAGEFALAANPYVLGWDYESFGVWDSSSSGGIRATSFGAPTPGSAVPTSGAATFTGKLAGLYVSPSGQGSIAAADLAVHANFSSRSLAFSSTGTTITRDLDRSLAAPHLNLGGTLTYAPGSNSFAGSLTSASATMSGQSNGKFYGPSAQELGGVFSLKAQSTVETFTGAYGARR